MMETQAVYVQPFVRAKSLSGVSGLELEPQEEEEMNELHGKAIEFMKEFKFGGSRKVLRTLAVVYLVQAIWLIQGGQKMPDLKHVLWVFALIYVCTGIMNVVTSMRTEYINRGVIVQSAIVAFLMLMSFFRFGFVSMYGTIVLYMVPLFYSLYPIVFVMDLTDYQLEQVGPVTWEVTPLRSADVKKQHFIKQRQWVATFLYQPMKQPVTLRFEENVGFQFGLPEIIAKADF